MMSTNPSEDCYCTHMLYCTWLVNKVYFLWKNHSLLVSNRNGQDIYKCRSRKITVLTYMSVCVYTNMIARAYNIQVVSFDPWDFCFHFKWNVQSYSQTSNLHNYENNSEWYGTSYCPITLPNKKVYACHHTFQCKWNGLPICWKKVSFVGIS